MFPRASSWVLATMFACGLGSAPAGGQRPSVPETIYIRFVLEPPEARLVFTDAAAAEKNLSADMAKVFASRFPWQFEAADARAFPRIQVTIQKLPQEWGLKLELISNLTAVPRRLGRITLWKPGDLAARGGLPRPSRFSSEIATPLDQELLVPQRREILQVLREIPLGLSQAGSEVVAGPIEASAVLPLDVAQYGALAASWFRIRCKHQGSVPVFLRSKAIGWHEYKPGKRVFDGILIRHIRMVLVNGTEQDVDQNLGELANLQPIAFYLEEVVDEQDPLISVVPPR